MIYKDSIATYRDQYMNEEQEEADILDEIDEEEIEESEEDYIKDEIAEEMVRIEDPNDCSKNYTWYDFYSAFEKDRQENGDFATSAYIGWVLMAPTLKRRPDYWNAERRAGVSIEDVSHDMFLAIYKNIKNYDPTKSKFQTFMDKFIKGIIRELKDNGASDYQIRNKGVNFVSYEEYTTTEDPNSEYTKQDFADPNATVEVVLEKQYRERTNEIFKQLVSETNDTIPEKSELYTNIAFLHKFLGGINNLPHYVKDEIEDSLGL